MKAIQFWEQNTCLHFEHYQDKLDEEDDYIEFFKGQG